MTRFKSGRRPPCPARRPAPSRLERILAPTPRLRVIFCLLCATAAVAQDAEEPIPIPRERVKQGAVEAQRIRFLNTPLLERAHRAVGGHDYRAAAGFFEQALANDPENNHIKVYLIRIYDRLERWKEGMALCDSLIESYPGYRLPYLYKGQMAFKDGQLRLAVDALGRLEREGGLPAAQLRQVLRGLAEAHFRLANYEQAVVYGGKWRKHHDTPEVDRFLAECRIAQKQWRPALDLLNRAAQRTTEPDLRAGLLMKKGYVCYELADYVAAERALLRADGMRASLLPEQAAAAPFVEAGVDRVKALLMQVYDALGKWEEGLAVCDSLIAASPAYLDAHFYKGQMAIKAARLPLAIETLGAVERRGGLPPERLPLLYRSLAQAHFLAGDLKAAEAYGRKWQEREDTPEADRFLAECWIAQARWAEARAAVDRALGRVTEPRLRGKLLLQQGYVLYELGNYAEAETAFLEADRLLAGDADREAILNQLAQVAFKAGHHATAAARFEASLKSRWSETTAAAYLNALAEAERWEQVRAEARSFLGVPGVSEPFRVRCLEALTHAEKELGHHDAYYAAAKRLLAARPEPRYRLECAVAARRTGALSEAMGFYKRYLDETFDPAVAMDYHYLLRKRGRLDEAEALLRRVIEQKEVSRLMDVAARYELAQTHRAAGDEAGYAAVMESLLDKSPEPDFLVEYGGRLLADGRDGLLTELAERSLAAAKTAPEKYELSKRIAAIYLGGARAPEAKAWLARASQHGGPDEEWQVAMARLDYMQGEYDGVIARLGRHVRSREVAHLLMGFAWFKMNRPGLALYHLKQVQDTAALNPDERYHLYANRAYLYFDQGCFKESLSDFANALARRRTDKLEVGRILALTRLPLYDYAREEGRRLLPRLAPGASELRAQLLEALGQCSLALGDFRQAAADLTDAVRTDPARVNLYYLRGLARFKLGSVRKAREDFARYLESGQDVPASFLGDLGIAEGLLGNYENASAALIKALAAHPYDVGSTAELGYQRLKARKNADAAGAFKQAIETYNAILPYLPEAEAPLYREARRALKLEYAKLRKRWGGQAYLNRAEYDEEIPAGGTESAGGALVSQAGGVLTYRPPVIGFMDERELDLFARILMNFEPKSFDPDETSYQGGVGIQYKPLSDVNFRTSIERLFKIGENAEDNWLWRNMLGLDWGERRRRQRVLWLAGSLYGEMSYYVEEPARWVYVLDGRLGVSWSIGNRVALTVPQVMGFKRHESDDASGLGRYHMFGAGLKLRVLEPERAYVTERWYVDLAAQYVRGSFEEDPAFMDEPEFDGWLFGVTFVK
ncbi:MAG: tetratricopeptide repeat protein [Kiritimatiellae bacterium]|nr:tetratricopeptide repeat protein [Kiritimatiellia bacterium]